MYKLYYFKSKSTYTVMLSVRLMISWGNFFFQMLSLAQIHGLRHQPFDLCRYKVNVNTSSPLGPGNNSDKTKPVSDTDVCNFIIVCVLIIVYKKK